MTKEQVIKQEVERMRDCAKADKETYFKLYEEAKKEGNENDANYWYNQYCMERGQIVAYTEVLFALNRYE